jgi:hypothetical protein
MRAYGKMHQSEGGKIATIECRSRMLVRATSDPDSAILESYNSIPVETRGLSPKKTAVLQSCDAAMAKWVCVEHRAIYMQTAEVCAPSSDIRAAI